MPAYDGRAFVTIDTATGELPAGVDVSLTQGVPGDVQTALDTKSEAPLTGTGSPEGVVTADVGALYVDTAGSTGAWQWIKSSGTGNTGWTARTDVTYLRSLIVAGQVCRIPGGTYTLNPGTDGPLVIPSDTTVELSPATVLQCAAQSTGTFNMVLIDGVSNVKIKGGSIVGDRTIHIGTAGEWGMGIYVRNSQRVTLDSIVISDHWGDGIYIGGGSYVAGEICRNVQITDCIITNARRQGISITHADTVSINRCTVTDINGVSPQYGIDIETNDNAYPCRNITVKNCHFSGSVGAGFGAIKPVVGLTISGCTFDGDDVILYYLTSGFITGCTVTGGAHVAVSDFSTGVVISGNLLIDTKVGVYSYYGAVTDSAIRGNMFINADGDVTREAIKLSGSQDVGADHVTRIVITGNVISGYVAKSIYAPVAVDHAVLNDNLITSEPSGVVMSLIGGWTVNGNRFVTGAASPFSGAGVPSDILTTNTVTTL